MKFSCGRCGKRYATGDTLAPGRVYKLRCKACGHLIVVKAGATVAASAPAQPDASGGISAPSPASSAPPEIQLEIDAPEPAAPSNGAPAAEPPAFQAPTVELSTPTPAALPPQQPAGDPGYVDLFSDLGGSSALPLEEKQVDPFLAAARASLPDAYGSGGSAPDPFAPLHEPRRDPAPAAAAAPIALPKIPVIPKPPPQKIGLPLALMGGGVAVLVGILAFVLLGPKKPPPVAGAAAPALAQAPAPAQAQVPPPVPATPAPAPAAPRPEIQPAAAPVAAARAEAPPEPRRTSADDRRQREERRRREREEAQAREARARETRDRERAERELRAREERERRDRERAERDARARETRERESRGREEQRTAAAHAPEEAAGALSEAQIEGAVRSSRRAFDGCIDAARGAGAKLDGRRVMLRLNIQPSGSVTYPTLDDVTLSGTDLGSCLKDAAKRMVFPRFEGETMHVEVPLVVK